MPKKVVRSKQLSFTFHAFFLIVFLLNEEFVFIGTMITFKNLPAIKGEKANVKAAELQMPGMGDVTKVMNQKSQTSLLRDSRR